MATHLGWLQSPRGGTEIGRALERVFSDAEAQDVLLITDGMSYALDVHRLAGARHRVCVVLVGEDSLEANVGHLAALAGGSIHFSFGLDVENALRAALGTLRTNRAPSMVAPQGTEPLDRLETIRGNARVEARWGQDNPQAKRERTTRAAAVEIAALVRDMATWPDVTEAAAERGLPPTNLAIALVLCQPQMCGSTRPKGAPRPQASRR